MPDPSRGQEASVVMCLLTRSQIEQLAYYDRPQRRPELLYPPLRSPRVQETPVIQLIVQPLDLRLQQLCRSLQAVIRLQVEEHLHTILPVELSCFLVYCTSVIELILEFVLPRRRSCGRRLRTY